MQLLLEIFRVNWRKSGALRRCNKKERRHYDTKRIFELDREPFNLRISATNKVMNKRIYNITLFETGSRYNLFDKRREKENSASG